MSESIIEVVLEGEFTHSPGAENMMPPQVVTYKPGEKIEQIIDPNTGRWITIEVLEEVYH